MNCKTIFLLSSICGYDDCKDKRQVLVPFETIMQPLEMWENIQESIEKDPNYDLCALSFSIYSIDVHCLYKNWIGQYFYDL